MSKNMNWIKLENKDNLEDLKKLSETKNCLIFKHSTRCATSYLTLKRLERAWNDSEMLNVQPYFLDLIANRELSNRISEDFKINHESPQALLIKNGGAFLDLSHFGIDYSSLKQALNN